MSATTSWYRQPEDSFRFKWWRFWSRLGKLPGKLWWVLRYHTTDRYHMLDLRTRNYRRGWQDCPERMELALFACLVHFVEKEEAFYPEPIVDWDDNKELQAVRGKALELYEWWTSGQYTEDQFLALITCDCPSPFEFKAIPGTDLSEMVFDKHPRWAQYTYWHDRLEAKRKRMFQMLVDIREWLWV